MPLTQIISPLAGKRFRNEEHLKEILRQTQSILDGALALPVS